MSEIEGKPTFRIIDGVSIRFLESDPGDSDALLLSPWPESVFAYEPTWSRLAETTHLGAIDLPGFGRSERKDALMSPCAMGDFIVRAADARVAFYDGTWILNAMIEQSCAPRVSSTVAEAFR
jgi:pimeloyl-ACP methyl ester carboxylesterase